MKVYYESKPDELQHWLGFGKKQANTKYIHKIPLGNGQFRYFYTNEELEAYMNAQKRVANRQESVVNSRDEAFRKNELQRNEAQKRAENRQESMANRRDKEFKKNEFKRNINKTVTNVKNSVDQLNEKLKDASGRKYYKEANETRVKQAKEAYNASIYERMANDARKKQAAYEEESAELNSKMRKTISKKKRKSLGAKAVDATEKSARANYSAMKRDSYAAEAQKKADAYSEQRKELEKKGDKSLYGLIQNIKKKQKKKKKKK